MSNENRKLWCNVPDVYFIYHGEWSDPEVMYQDKLFNLPMDVEYPLWSEYEESCEEFGKKIGDPVREWDNPYFGFPKMIRFAFNPNFGYL